MSNCDFKGCFTQKDGPECKYNVINYPFYCTQLNMEYQHGKLTTSILASIKELYGVVNSVIDVNPTWCNRINSNLFFIIDWFLQLGICKETKSRKCIGLDQTDVDSLLNISYDPLHTTYRISGVTGAELVGRIYDIKPIVKDLIRDIMNHIMHIVENKGLLVLCIAKFIGFHRKIADKAFEDKNPYKCGVYRGWYIGLLQQLYLQSNAGKKTSITADLKYYTKIIQIAQAYTDHAHDKVVELLSQLDDSV
jgi:hypothetical protein